MENKPDVHLSTLLVQYDIHTVLLSKTINRLSERDLNHFRKGSDQISSLIARQIKQRLDLAIWISIKENSAAQELFLAKNKTKYNIVYPTFDEAIKSLNDEWKKISWTLRNAIVELDNDNLYFLSKKYPGFKEILFDLLSNVVQIEENYISIMTLLRGYNNSNN